MVFLRYLPEPSILICKLITITNRKIENAIPTILNKMRIKRSALILAQLLLTATAFSQDKKFYIFLCFGQSNMEGNAKFEPEDSIVNK